jgi:hypothetical protein
MYRNKDFSDAIGTDGKLLPGNDRLSHASISQMRNGLEQPVPRGYEMTDGRSTNGEGCFGGPKYESGGCI